MLRSKKQEYITKQPRKRRRQTPKKLTLTPEVQALYFQCLAGKLHQLSGDDQRLIIQVFNQQFPTLKREALRFRSQQSKTPSFLQTLVNWVLYMVLLIFGILIVLVALEYYAKAEPTSSDTRPPQQQMGKMIPQVQYKEIKDDILSGKNLSAQ
ncbi:hypothetical protein CSA56_13295 [candidate division KSB3 bacterium]|uniref:Uncharacterized protein n=1 Tax=candidate division KSB3 bacterium TaxID=2044937 RepID=A0A2G6KBH1_9BACT|nr:MAG: hypothetical protein CSA56_13295 [candidate division KSB3 bacterium]